MRSLVGLALSIALCVGLVSCEDNNMVGMPFEPFEFEVKGIVLNSDKEQHYCVIPWSGGQFIITSTGKHTKYDWAEYLIIDNIPQVPEMDAFVDPEIEEAYSGEWGKATHLTAGPPYVSEYVIYPNETDEPREIEINMSGKYIHAHIHITQLPKP